MTSDTGGNPYASEYPPNNNVDSEIKALIAHYYKQVDTKGKHAEYSECWTKNGSLMLPNGKELIGRRAISELHTGMWDGVSKRLHRPKKIFPFGDKADELVIVDTVEYWTDDGSYQKKDMAAHVKYTKDPTAGRTEMSSLQVWLTG